MNRPMDDEELSAEELALVIKEGIKQEREQMLKAEAERYGIVITTFSEGKT